MAFKAIFFTLFIASFSAGAQPLVVSADDRYIETEDGKPFFWLGDTAWELFHRLDREESKHYLKNRADKGFTVIQAVVLAELEGLTTGNADGEVPLLGQDPARPNEAYFEHIDDVVNMADSLGLYIGMLPTWGDKFNKRWGVGPEVFTADNAYTFGKFLSNRYADKPIVWILGGDRIPEEQDDFDIINAMAKGIREGRGGHHLMAYHPMGGRSSAEFFHDAAWLDVNMFQSGHGDLDNQNYKKTLHDYALKPTKPVIDAEPGYEDHPINWKAANGWLGAFESRRAGYWSMLAGAFGHTYGNHNVWQMWQPGRTPISQARTPWRQSLDQPGAFQAGYMQHFFENIEWQDLQPQQDKLVDGPNAAGKDVLVAAAPDATLLVAYTPYGSNFTLNLSGFGSKTNASWFNPRNNTYLPLGPIPSGDKHTFDPPADEMRGNDWVLLLQKNNND
jgi:hypothetical protein